MLQWVPLIVFLVGLVLYLLPLPSGLAKVGDLGRIGVWVGLVFLVAQAVLLHDLRPLPH